MDVTFFRVLVRASCGAECSRKKRARGRRSLGAIPHAAHAGDGAAPSGPRGHLVVDRVDFLSASTWPHIRTASTAVLSGVPPAAHPQTLEGWCSRRQPRAVASRGERGTESASPSRYTRGVPQIQARRSRACQRESFSPSCSAPVATEGLVDVASASRTQGRGRAAASSSPAAPFAPNGKLRAFTRNPQLLAGHGHPGGCG